MFVCKPLPPFTLKWSELLFLALAGVILRRRSSFPCYLGKELRILIRVQMVMKQLCIITRVCSLSVNRCSSIFSTRRTSRTLSIRSEGQFNCSVFDCTGDEFDVCGIKSP